MTRPPDGGPDLKQYGNMKKVVKFGGSSLADAAQFKKVAEIIHADESRVYVIPSAPGKRFSGDTKVTDLLYHMYEEAKEKKDFSKTLQTIKDRYDQIIKGLGLKNFSLDREFDVIEHELLDDPDEDYTASRGEYLNGRIMARYLKYEFIDAQGYNMKVKTFSRGGSDITGSIVAGACKADVYENWTDVSGFMVADPRIVSNPVRIETITYRELRELSYMGASVLHEEAIFPVRHEGIPINIRNTNAPDEDGTWIVESTCQKSGYVVTGIAGKKGFCTVLISKAMMNSEIGFGRKVLQAFEENQISFEHMPSGIDTMTIVVHEDEFMDKEQRVVSAIHRLAGPDSVEIESDLALIAVVGRGMKSTRGTAGRIFSALAHAHVNVRMIDQGSSELNIIIGVENEDFETAIRAIYDIFVLTQI